MSGPTLTRPKTLIPIIVASVALLAGATYFWLDRKKTAESEAQFAQALALAVMAVRAEENFTSQDLPPIAHSSEAAQTLTAGVIAFNQGRFPAAIAAFDGLLALRPNNLDLISLSAAAHLREKNYSLAAQKYREILGGPDFSLAGSAGKANPKPAPAAPNLSAAQELRATSDELGYSLAQFHLRNFEEAKLAAEKAYGLRKKRLGAFNRETISSANILASALMALNENEEAGRLLKETTMGALGQGLKESDPVLADALNLLTLAYTLTERLDELADLALFREQMAEPEEESQPDEVAQSSPETQPRSEAQPGSGPQPGSEAKSPAPAASPTGPGPRGASGPAESPEPVGSPKQSEDRGPTAATSPASPNPAKASKTPGPGLPPDSPGTASQPATPSRALASNQPWPPKPSDSADSPSPPRTPGQAASPLHPGSAGSPKPPSQPAGPDPKGPTPQAAGAGPRAKTLTPSEFSQALAIWKSLLPQAEKSPLTPGLLTAMIQSVNGGLAPGEQPSEVALTDLMDLRGQARGCLELANHYQKTGDPRKALFVLVPLTEWVPSEERETTYSLMGLTFGALGQWSQAEEALRQAQELLPAKPDAAAVGKFVSVSIALSDALSKQGRIAEEAELELVAALTRLQKMLPKAELNRSPDVAKLYVRLAQVLKGRPRSKDRANYYRLAEKNLAAAEKAYPAKAAEIAALKSQIPGAKKALTPPKGQAKEPGPAPESALSPPLPAGLPSPELLRLEMSGYRLIDRLSEFEPRIAGALATAQSPEGRDAPYPKYLSLWLKFLEENGDEERLLSELDRLAENPLGSSPNARSQFILAALNYKARVLAKGDRKEEALAIYRRMSKDPTLSQSLTKDQMQDLAASVKSLESPAD